MKGVWSDSKVEHRLSDSMCSRVFAQASTATGTSINEVPVQTFYQYNTKHAHQSVKPA